MDELDREFDSVAQKNSNTELMTPRLTLIEQSTPVNQSASYARETQKSVQLDNLCDDGINNIEMRVELKQIYPIQVTLKKSQTKFHSDRSNDTTASNIINQYMEPA